MELAKYILWVLVGTVWGKLLYGVSMLLWDKRLSRKSKRVSGGIEKAKEYFRSVDRLGK